MKYTTSIIYALRHLKRHMRRTLISILGIGLGTGLGVFAMSWVGGGRDLQIRSIVESGTGNLQIIPKGWLDKRSTKLRLEDWKSALEVVNKHENTKSATPQVATTGFFAFGNKTLSTEVEGVIPSLSAQTSRMITRGKIEGRYLTDDSKREIVVGYRVAELLSVELEDTILVRISGKEEVEVAMFTIVGLLTTNNKEIDKAFAHVHMKDIEDLSGRKGVSKISIILKDHSKLRESVDALSAKMPLGNEVADWKQIMPSMAANIEGDTAFTGILIFIIMVVVGLGIVGSQLTAVLERRKEFAILVALGMKTRQLVILVMFEAVVLGIGGAIAGLLISAWPILHFAIEGLDLAAMAGENGMDFSAKIFFDPVYYAASGIWIVWSAFAMSMVATIAASIYPAWFAVKTDPAEALRVV